MCVVSAFHRNGDGSCTRLSHWATTAPYVVSYISKTQILTWLTTKIGLQYKRNSAFDLTSASNDRNLRRSPSGKYVSIICHHRSLQEINKDFKMRTKAGTTNTLHLQTMEDISTFLLCQGRESTEYC